MKSDGYVQRWRRLSRRERGLILLLMAGLLGGAVFTWIWQPNVQRLEALERQHRQQQAFAIQLDRTQPPSSSAFDATQPLSLRISESLNSTGLEVQQMDSDNEQIRLTLSGPPEPLLLWLDRLERDGVVLQSLSLEPRDNLLEARLQLR